MRAESYRVQCRELSWDCVQRMMTRAATSNDAIDPAVSTTKPDAWQRCGASVDRTCSVDEQLATSRECRAAVHDRSPIHHSLAFASRTGGVAAMPLDLFTLGQL